MLEEINRILAEQEARRMIAVKEMKKAKAKARKRVKEMVLVA